MLTVQIGFPKKRTLRQTLVCKMLNKKFAWNQHLCRGGRDTAGWGRGRSWVVMQFQQPQLEWQFSNDKELSKVYCVGPEWKIFIFMQQFIIIREPRVRDPFLPLLWYKNGSCGWTQCYRDPWWWAQHYVTLTQTVVLAAILQVGNANPSLKCLIKANHWHFGGRKDPMLLTGHQPVSLLTSWGRGD